VTRARGNRLQNALAAYLTRWWEHAESAGAGRNGSDVLGTPGVVWEAKTAVDFKRDFKPTAWMRQAERHLGVPAEFMPHMVPVVVYFPAGIGEKNTANTLAIVPLHVLMRVLEQAGYTPQHEKTQGKTA
jgi:hypothetical protein